MNSMLLRLLLPAGCLLAPALAESHAFVQPYTLPVPFSMYAFGAAAALVLSFAVIGLLANRTVAAAATDRPGLPQVDAATQAQPSVPMVLGRTASLALLVLCIVAGFAGTSNPQANINMTLFWIVFVLGVPYAVAVLGDFYATLNPWRVLVDTVARLPGIGFRGRLRDPERLGCTPALLLYMAFIWLELFAQLSPRGLSTALFTYTGINLAGAWLLGRDAWFRQGEFFGVLLRLLGRMSPWAPPWNAIDCNAAAAKGMSRWRMPFSGLLQESPRDLSLAVFILFMLSSTAFDGLHATAPWTLVFWRNVYPELAPWFPAAPGRTYVVSVQIYHAWQGLWLLASPLAYLLVFAAFLWLARGAAGVSMPLRELVLRFAPSLVPIAFVYHVTHYYTLLLAQGGQLVRLVSDPLGWGWDLFGTASRVVKPLMLDVEAIWHTQVALILMGHIVSVYLAHMEALRCFATPRRAAVSQLPMLGLMMLFTTFGLWILSLPLATGG